jgi:hypothetical protein
MMKFIKFTTDEVFLVIYFSLFLLAVEFKSREHKNALFLFNKNTLFSFNYSDT